MVTDTVREPQEAGVNLDGAIECLYLSSLPAAKAFWPQVVLHGDSKVAPCQWRTGYVL